MSDRFASIAGFIAFGALALGAYFQGDRQAFVLALLLIGFSCCLIAYQWFRQRKTLSGGPPDPSMHWGTNESRPDSNVQVFRYSPGTILTVRIIAMLMLLPGFVVYAVAKPRPIGTELIVFIVFWAVFFGVFFLGYEACKRYVVEVSRVEIVHYRLRAPIRYPFSSLGSVALLESGGRGAKYVLALFDQRGRQVDQFGDALDGFNEMVALVKQRAAEAGVKYRYRDMWGSWTA